MSMHTIQYMTDLSGMCNNSEFGWIAVEFFDIRKPSFITIHLTYLEVDYRRAS